MTTTATKTRPPLTECIRLIPGYDPFHNVPDGWYFDEKQAARYVGFIEECCSHIEGTLAGQPFRLEIWQVAIVANAFGWRRPDGGRRYREVLVYIPRKNGKTPLAAAMTLASMSLDGEIGAYNVCAAADADQAALLFRQAAGMIENEEELYKRFRVFKGIGQRAISYESQGSRLKVVSSDANTKHGGNGHLAMVDELHAQKNRDLVDVLSTSMASANRLQPLLAMLTTADFDRESICNEKHDYACKVRDRVIDDPAFLPVVYEATIEDDWTDPEVWEKSNPNMGVSVSREYLERECKKAQDIPAYENTFKRLHLNIKTQQNVRWLQLEQWDRCGIDKGEDPEAWRNQMLQRLKGRPCIAALDVSSRRDLTALVLRFDGDEEDDPPIIVPFFWMPQDNAERKEREDRVPYSAWKKAGFIDFTPGDIVDQEAIKEKIGEIDGLYGIRVLAFDPWNATQLAIDLEERGINVLQFQQTIRNYNEPIKEFESRIVAGNIKHGSNPILRWMAGNVSVYIDANANVRMDKKNSRGRIDGVVASVMAEAMHITGFEDNKKIDFWYNNNEYTG